MASALILISTADTSAQSGNFGGLGIGVNYQGSFRTYQNKIASYTSFPFNGDHISVYYNVLQGTQFVNPYQTIRAVQNSRMNTWDDRRDRLSGVSFQPLTTSIATPSLTTGGYKMNATGHTTRFLTFQPPPVPRQQ